MNHERQLLEALQQPGAYPVFVTGAGISVASGIAPFRGTDDAVWAKDVMEMATRSFFLRKPHESWSWYLERFAKCWMAEPNPAHFAITAIESKLKGRGDNFTLVTQNIDGLHVKAGTQDMIECHGSARHIRCTNINCVNGPPRGLMDWSEEHVEVFRVNPTHARTPRCPECNKFLRPHVLWFDESYSDHDAYGMDRIDTLMNEMTVLIFVGTSFSVTITDLFMTAAYQEAVPMFMVDPTDECVDEIAHIKRKAEVFLPLLASGL